MKTIAREYRPCQIPRVKDPPTGLDGLVDSTIGGWKRRPGILAGLKREAKAIDALEEDWKFLSEAALKRHLLEFRERFRRADKDAEECLPDALAAIREAADRVTGMRPFVVQLMGALALHRGYLAEMATGEGKTLTAALAAVLTGWTGKPCHIITVNDYLAKRDSEWFQPLYEFCGVSVGAVTSIMHAEDRTLGYSKDVTYTTSKEVVADFLRDRLRLGDHQHPTQRLLQRHLHPYHGEDHVVMRGLHTAIVDEADSVLIDEAVTPLIISSPTNNNQLHQVYKEVWKITNQLKKDEHYRVDLRYKEAVLLPRGKQVVESHLSMLPERWRGASRPVELVEQALNAREFFRRGKQYVVQKNKVVIVDEFSGRMMANRKWRHGLHQAIEAKEGLPLSPIDQTLARLSFQRYYRLYTKLSGMTGTAHEAAREVWHTYHLPVVRIPTNRPVIRQELPHRIYPSIELKMDAIVADVEANHLLGRPVLVGTRNVATSQILAKRLHSEGFKIELLNALNDRQEASIIARAGRKGAITIATNMAGRGTDIKLGEGVAELGGLHVIASERHEARRIDRQLFGRSGRQGDPGTAVAFISCEDELLLRFAPKWLLGLFTKCLKNRLPGGRMIGLLTNNFVQWKAQKIALYSRKSVLKMDTWLDEAISFSGKSLI
ncbi:prepilin peptidase [Puniceicoccales bacterium CK1056]|uniref:Protein translocase subunit SecA n=1 Tax=Oceanipulchritudo coccoides TaxID=2706888 RepID=A0A6B2M2B8_9BACT|nr:prepilin peptidase [Oceanipulchritudo coccoides]NDV62883.1 prepilin peptidase [Oceanipulchritudo coccoides]